jgi:Gamma tubulin complex component N-terminal
LKEGENKKMATLLEQHNSTGNATDGMTGKQTKLEAAILRECTYALLGISGDILRVYTLQNSDGSKQEGIRVAPQVHEIARNASAVGSSGTLDAIYLCAEVGWLYQRLQRYVVELDTSAIGRALARALNAELQQYQQLIGTLVVDVHDLRELVAVVTTKPLQTLKTLACLILEDTAHQPAAARYGPHLLTALHKHSTIHGDSTRRVPLLRNLLTAAAQPYYQMIYEWITEGEIADHHCEEFFVAAVVAVPNTASNNLYHSHELRRDRVPEGVLDDDLVDLIYGVGRGVHYIRHSLHQGGWSVTSELHNSNDGDDAGHAVESLECLARGQEPVELHAALQQAATLVHRHILCTLQTEHGLLDH